MRVDWVSKEVKNLSVNVLDLEEKEGVNIFQERLWSVTSGGGKKLSEGQ